MPFGEAGGMTCTTRLDDGAAFTKSAARGERDRHVDLRIMPASGVIIVFVLLWNIAVVNSQHKTSV
jgi:hypothetical protein